MEDTEKERRTRLAITLLQVGSNDVYDVVSGFFRGFGIPRHVVSDVVLHQFAHKAVDGATGGGQALKHFRALLIFVEAAKDAFELADNLFGASDKIEFFARCM